MFMKAALLITFLLKLVKQIVIDVFVHAVKFNALY